jgi:hypothetical protein
MSIVLVWLSIASRCVDFSKGASVYTPAGSASSFRARQFLDSLALLWSAVFISSCCHYPKAVFPNKQPPAAVTAGTPISLVVYGDTRTGPWGLGDNNDQAVHARLAKEVRKLGRIDAILFTGDAVMTNSEPLRNCYWTCFRAQTDQYVKNFNEPYIPFYPTMGNHETYTSIPLFRLATANTVNLDGGCSDVASCYESGEELAFKDVQALDGSSKPQEALDFQSPVGQKLLKRWEKEIRQGNRDSALKFGQYEGTIQANFYLMPSNSRCDADEKLFYRAYVEEGKYAYLKPVIAPKSYYSRLIPSTGKPKVKIIALDTNCLDSEQQMEFFKTEVTAEFDGPIIVFGHHPPQTDNLPDVKGWSFYKDYLGTPEGHKVALWIFGHRHIYERRSANNSSPSIAAPVLLVAGGGGATLDSVPNANEWQPSSWDKPLVKSRYSFVQLTVKDDSIDVTVLGERPKTPNDFEQIDKFTISPLSNP